ncbi:MAG: Ig-like domain-containing protein [Clostridia bacterium]
MPKPAEGAPAFSLFPEGADEAVEEEARAAFEDAVLDEAEKRDVANGAPVSIEMRVEAKAEKELDSGIADIVKEKLEGGTVGVYWDIGMTKKIGGAAAEKVVTLKKAIKLVIDIPKDLQDSSRVFCVLHVHDAPQKATVCSDLDANPTTVTIETAGFSTCALIYKPKSGGGGGPAPVAVTGVTMAQALSVKVGERATLVAAIAPENASDKAVTWTTSDALIATVDGGVVTGVAKGTTEITVTTRDGGFTATCAVTVAEAGPDEPDDPGKAEPGITRMAVRNGNALTLPVLKGYKGSWTSADEGVARIAKGGKRVTGAALGTTKLIFTVEKATAKAIEIGGAKLAVGDQYVITMNVRRKGETASSVSISDKKLKLDPGETASLTATAKPAGKVLDPEIFWTSSNARVATVDEKGVVTAVGAGKCKITAITTNLKQVSTAVTVTKKGQVTKIDILEGSGQAITKLQLLVDESCTLTARVNEDALDTRVTWKSKNPKIAQVDAETGVVTARKKGKTTITATAPGGTKATCKLTVK